MTRLTERGRRNALDHLDDAELAQQVADLGPDGLAALVADVGLADAGHWLALATPAQVLEVLDAELWSVRRGDERFDPRQFATWLEALVEVGDEIAADQLAAMPLELAVAGTFRQALVFDTDELWLAVARGLMDPAIDDQPQVEIGEHLVVGRGLDGWDALVATLVTLAERHPEVTLALLEHCRELTDRAVGEASLEEALLDEGGEEDAFGEREDRRARRGFVAPHAARSFLALAVEIDLQTQLAFGGRDPVTAAYFRDWEREAGPVAPGLVRAGAAGARPEELGYLVQVVVAGCERDGRPFTVEEAAEAVVAVCRIGEAVGRGPADALFRFGYHVLHARVVVPARLAGDRSGLHEAIPRLDGRFLASLDDVALAEARVAAGPPRVAFEARIARDAPALAPYLVVPAEAASALGTRRVLCRIGGSTLRARLASWGEAHRMELPATFAAGDTVAVELEPEPDADLPRELAEALAEAPEARRRWYALPQAQQRAWAERVRSGTQRRARQRRAALVVARLR
ncbi:MAG: DUF6178 family protein [Myxococcota bacterium]